MKTIHLLGKTIDLNKCPIVFQYDGETNWQDFFEVKKGEWTYQDGYLVGKETKNQGGILFTKKRFDFDIVMTFKMASILPSTRDLNAVWCSKWDEKADYLGPSYVCGLNGWYEGLSGIEKNVPNGFVALTSLYPYLKGEELEITCGSINGHCFLFVGNTLICEVVDPTPLKGGYAGFSPYCTNLKIKDVVIHQIFFKKREQKYEMEK